MLTLRSSVQDLKALAIPRMASGGPSGMVLRKLGLVAVEDDSMAKAVATCGFFVPDVATEMKARVSFE